MRWVALFVRVKNMAHGIEETYRQECELLQGAESRDQVPLWNVHEHRQVTLNIVL